MKSKLTHSDWHGLYKESWSGQIVPDAFAHPAKFSRALIRQIYKFLREEGLLHDGDTVLDPFGGVALGGLDAMLQGAHWIGVELEQKFVDLGEQNIARWNKRYSKMPKWGTARIVQGDSQQLSKVVGEAGLVVSSPPFAEAQGAKESPGGIVDTNRKDLAKYLWTQGNAGNTEGNLGNLRADEHKLDAIVSSPPFLRTEGGEKGIIRDGLDRADGTHQDIAPRHYHSGNIGNSAGQLGTMPSGDIDAVISSPPYEGIANERQHSNTGIAGRESAKGNKSFNFRYTDSIVTSPPYEADIVRKRDGGSPPQDGQAYGVTKGKHIFNAYSDAGDNLGNARGEDFWSATQIILQECFKILKPGGTAVFVTKRFIRNKKIVEFSQQWARLCKSGGFQQTHWIKAWVVEEYGTQTALDGKHKKKIKERKSFFRRLAEQKGSPHIDWEDVLIFKKPVV